MSTPRKNDAASDRIWLVTGASSGLGWAIAEAALAAGDTVIAAARTTAALATLVADHPDRAFALELDVTDTARIAPVVAELIAQHGRIDVLVNSAGRGIIGAAEETSDGELRDLMELHFFGPVALTRAVLPQMRERGQGVVVQITSQGGRFSFAGVSAYSASKFALEGFSEALALEVAPFGVDVLIVEPGSFRTGFAADGAMGFAEPHPAYGPLMEPLRTGTVASHGSQPGDPAKGASAILAALDADTMPLRLVLGSDAADAVVAHLERSRAEFAAWESVSRSTDFAESPE